VNCAGISAFKLIMLLECHRADVVCLQETWMRQGADELSLPGYRWFEQRRSGRRGGIAILVKEGLHVSRVVGNEYAQLVELRTHGGAMCTVANVYLPPNNNLGRRHLTEQGVRDACETVLGRINGAHNVLLAGDFNARTGGGVPILEGGAHPDRVSADAMVCSRGTWLLGVGHMFGVRMLNGCFGPSSGQFTCVKHNGASVVDYMLANGPINTFEIHQHTLGALTDHCVLLCTAPWAPTREQ
jgi:hypothetical protein